MKNEMREIKGPFSYSGNKYKIWKSHLKNTMCNFSRIYEPFAGSGVCIYNANDGGIGIDIDKNVIALHNSLSNINLISLIENTYNKYFPNGRNEKSYYNLREDFNKIYVIEGTTINNAHMLHILVQLSFNSLLRFSKNGFNVPFGRKQVDFDRIKLHKKITNEKDISFICGNYNNLDLDKVSKERDLIYFDPPYIASKFQYGGWNKEEEIELLKYIDKISLMGYKFILSNTFLHRKTINQPLIDWSKNYNTKSIKMSYNS